MNEITDDFLDSLDLDDSQIVPFIPEILKDLWELGSIADYVVELVEKHIPQNKLKKVVDLGCGKGAVLIQLSEKVKFEGIGIDLMPQFIDDARNYAARQSYSKHLKFEVGDLKEQHERHPIFNHVIYGHDSDIFGDVTQSLLELEKYMSDESWIAFESLYSINPANNPEDVPNKAEFMLQIEKSGLEIVEQIVWNREKLRNINQANTASISKQITELIKSYPEKENLFTTYLENQIEECQDLEQNLECLTVLLKRKSPSKS